MLLKELNNLKELKVIKELIKRGNILMIELGIIVVLIVGVNEMMKCILPISSVLLGILVMLLIHWYPISDCIFIPKLLKRTLDTLK
ncbi:MULTISPECIES: hypothetical protein [Bacillus]|uniref:hypothetical protein n=1 Tax=Bacillus TaxID=1386 RepID=UPI002111FCF2|nr:hypothetical protein [Bacillus paranthracis]MCQ6520062.1 hypothetical protein [Bacillus paranthracis]MCU5227267.1 hypothetical protein [Bacillus paranthracis]MEC4603864.1 hypothetical protein [Bacillus paranthracis]